MLLGCAAVNLLMFAFYDAHAAKYDRAARVLHVLESERVIGQGSSRMYNSLGEDSVPDLEAIVGRHCERTQIRLMAIGGLVWWGLPSSRPVLIAAMNDSDPKVRDGATRAVLRLGAPDLANFYYSGLARASDPSWAGEWARALLHAEGPAALPRISEVLNAPRQAQIRWATLEAILLECGDEALPLLATEGVDLQPQQREYVRRVYLRERTRFKARVPQYRFPDKDLPSWIHFRLLYPEELRLLRSWSG